MDCSTIDVDSARHVGGAAVEKGFRFVDAPVSGGVAAATAGVNANFTAVDDVQMQAWKRRGRAETGASTRGRRATTPTPRRAYPRRCC